MTAKTKTDGVLVRHLVAAEAIDRVVPTGHAG
jgi:hypothetical protein